MHDEFVTIIVMLTVFTMGCFIGGGIASSIQEGIDQRAAVSHKAATYTIENNRPKFTWKDEIKDEQ